MKKTKKIISWLLLLMVTFIILFPYIWMFLLSFKNNTEIMTQPFSFPKSTGFENYKRVLKTLNLSVMYKNTSLIALIALIISVSASFMCSYCISRLNFKNRKISSILYFYFIAGLTIPPYIMIFPIYRITMLLGLMNTRIALILPLAATTLALDILLLTGFLRCFPGEIEEAAIIDGCGIIRLCLRIVLPIAKPILATVIIFNVIYFWNEFPISSVLINKEEMMTISLSASMFKGRYSMDYGGLIAATVLITIPEIIFYCFFQKYLVDGMTAGAVKG